MFHWISRKSLFEEKINNDCLAHIFDLFMNSENIKEWGNLLRVCKRWKDVGEDVFSWNKVIRHNILRLPILEIVPCEVSVFEVWRTLVKRKCERGLRELNERGIDPILCN